MKDLDERAMAILPDFIPTPRRCELCGDPRVVVAGIYVPGPGTQAAVRPRPDGPIGQIYGLCRGCRGRQGCIGMVEAKLSGPIPMAMVSAGRG